MVQKNKITRGGWNLVILGVVSVVVAVMTTGVSLAVYHNTGDIYLDRSRPGFLPDEEEIEESEQQVVEEEYDFGQNGSLTKEGLTEYLEKIGTEYKAINVYGEPFGDEVLSDEYLGITEKVAPTGIVEGVEEMIDDDTKNKAIEK